MRLNNGNSGNNQYNDNSKNINSFNNSMLSSPVLVRTDTSFCIPNQQNNGEQFVEGVSQSLNSFSVFNQYQVGGAEAFFAIQ